MKAYQVYDHTRRLEINYKEKNCKKNKYVESKQHDTKYLETKENGHTRIQNLQDAAKAVLRRKSSDTSLPQETKKSQGKQSKLKLTSKETTTTTKKNQS